MSANLGSVSYRNYPDVAMPADNIFTVYKNGTAIGGTGGTSAASPLWAGFMALVNQQAAALGKPAVGFVNPAIYALGKGPRAAYLSAFHDITTGNTYNSQNPTRYPAVAGYDLCTGWGSPTGSNTISALVGIGTNDFVFYPSQGTFNLIAGGVATATVTLTRMNGLTGNATFAISGLAAGITAVINPVITGTTTALTITTQTNTAPGSYSATLTGTMGGLSHTVALSIVVAAPDPGSGPGQPGCQPTIASAFTATAAPSVPAWTTRVRGYPPTCWARRFPGMVLFSTSAPPMPPTWSSAPGRLSPCRREPLTRCNSSAWELTATRSRER